MSHYRRATLTTLGVMLLFATLRQVDFPDELVIAQAAEKGKPRPEGRNEQLPPGAIARLGTPTLHENYLGALSVTFLSDGRTIVTAGPTKQLGFWDARTGRGIRSLGGYLSVAISPDGKTIASRSEYWKDKMIRLRDLAADKEIGQVEGGQGVRSFCLSADGRYLAVGGATASNPPLRVWEVATVKELQRFPLRDIVNVLTFSPNGKLVVTAKAQNLPPFIQIWDVATGKEVQSFLQEPDGSVASAVRISPDGALLAATGQKFFVWNLHTGKECWHIFNLDQKNPNDGGLDIAFSPNGQSMAVGTGKGLVYLLEPATGRERTRFDGRVSHVFSVAFSPCGLRLASAAQDCAPLVWDVTGLILSGSSAKPLAGKELETSWADLGSEDAAKAWKNICTLAARPDQAVPLIKERLLPCPKLRANRVAALLTDLESDNFERRDAATDELAKLGATAARAVRRLQAKASSTETKMRIAQILGKQINGVILPEEVRWARAIEVLEYAGTAQAKVLLQSYGDGEPVAALTQDANAALGRLAKRPPLR